MVLFFFDEFVDSENSVWLFGLLTKDFVLILVLGGSMSFKSVLIYLYRLNSSWLHHFVHNWDRHHSLPYRLMLKLLKLFPYSRRYKLLEHTKILSWGKVLMLCNNFNAMVFPKRKLYRKTEGSNLSMLSKS